MAGDAGASLPSLRFLTCGSVDDGKSTLIGRLLFESGKIFEDQLAALAADSRKVGTRGGEIDYALLLDGLEAERSQGITIDVAYRYFSTAKRRFIVADAPGHEQYTRNMATAASTADVAVVLVDVRNGVRPQTRRHSYIASLMGIRRVALAVNKMDLVAFSQQAFAGVEASYRELAQRLGFTEVTVIPLCATEGDNVTSRSARMPWYSGPTLLEYLETVDAGAGAQDGAFRMPVQWISRPDASFRGFAGPVVGGAVSPGMPVQVLPSGRKSRVARVVTASGDLEMAQSGEAVTLTLADEIDVARGDVIADARQPAECADGFEATLVWFSEAPLLPGRAYLMKAGAKTVTATVTPLKYRVDVESFEHAAASRLAQNDIGVVQLQTDQRIAFEPYARSRELGGFILLDRLTNETVAAGMLHFALRRATNVHWQSIDLDRNARAAIKHQKPCVLWFTGIPAAGKSTIANAVERRLHSMGRHTYLLDGDNVRHGLNKDLGFTEEARVENIRRVAEVAALMADAGLIVLVAFISPFRNERRMARALLPEGQFVEVFIDTPLATAEGRDPKGLYKKARAGGIKNFTGIDSPYEKPENPEIRIDTLALSPEAAAEYIVERIHKLDL